MTTNIQKDVEAIYDSNGNLQCRYVYDAWGKTKFVVDGNGNEVSGNNIGYINSIRYRGYYLDRETGLYYLQSRYYDPDTTRFINADDINYLNADILGTNLYSYCMNNPVNDSDPSGHLSLKNIFDIVFGFISYILSWIALVSSSKILSYVSIAFSLHFLVSGVHSFYKEHRKLNKYKYKIAVFGLLLCVVSNVINLLTSILGLSKRIMRKIGDLVIFFSSSFGLALSISSYLFDTIYLLKNATYVKCKGIAKKYL